MTPQDFDAALCALAEDKDLQKLARRLNSDADPNDTVQDVLLNLAKRPPETHANIQDLKRYAAKAVRNRSLELAIRKRRNPPFVELDKLEQDLAEALELASDLGNPHQAYEHEQLRKRLHKGMDTLTPRERLVARLTYLYGESIAEIAQRLHLTVHIVRGARERATTKINDALSGNNRAPTDRLSLRRSLHPGTARERAACWLVILGNAQNITPVLHTFRNWLNAGLGTPTDLARVEVIWHAMENLRREGG